LLEAKGLTGSPRHGQVGASRVVSLFAYGPAAGTLGGTADFLDRSRAGQAEILNMGASSGAAGTVGGRTRFRQASNAESAVITSFGGAAFSAPGGSLQFADDASAGAATL
jgi:hypothetical protein